MGSFRFLHAADLHIDSPLRGLSSYEGAPVEQLRQATREAFTNLCSLAIEEAVHFVVLAGDVYDGDWPDYHTGLFFVKQLNRLRDAGIRVVLLHGNHDAQSKMTKSLRLPDNVFVFGAASPESFAFEDVGVVFHGQSFKTQKVQKNLASAYPEPVSGACNIGVLHTALEGREGHDTYAPCKSSDLEQKGYGYWALGHVHLREVVCAEPLIVFPGNTQGRHARELGPKGCLICDVDEGVFGEPVFHPLDVVRWEHLEVDLSGETDEDGLFERFDRVLDQALDVVEGRLLAARVTFVGETELHTSLLADRERLVEELRARSFDGGREFFLEKVRLRTESLPESAEADATLDWLGEFPANAAGLVPGGDHPLRSKLPHSSRTAWDDADPDEVARQAWARLQFGLGGTSGEERSS
ncbi:MAG: DNA repair exonuclease [Planctomycetota bacterium]